ncbi:hypothetical protein D3C86_2067400 [compost metagenome]
MNRRFEYSAFFLAALHQPVNEGLGFRGGKLAPLHQLFNYLFYLFLADNGEADS